MIRGVLDGGSDHPDRRLEQCTLCEGDEKCPFTINAEYFPGESVRKVRDNCSFELKVSPHMTETEPPTPEELTLLRDIDRTAFYLR